MTQTAMLQRLSLQPPTMLLALAVSACLLGACGGGPDTQALQAEAVAADEGTGREAAMAASVSALAVDTAADMTEGVDLFADDPGDLLELESPAESNAPQEAGLPEALPPTRKVALASGGSPEVDARASQSVRLLAAGLTDPPDEIQPIDMQALPLSLVSHQSTAAAEPAQPRLQKAIFIDGSSGDDHHDGSDPAAPKRTLAGIASLNETALLIRRGTEVTLQKPLRAASVYIGAWGGGEAKPILRSPTGRLHGIVVLQGVGHVQGVSVIGDSNSRDTSAGVNAVRASRLVVIDSDIDGFFNGIKFAGDGGVIAGNRVVRSRNNAIIAGGAGYPAPSRTLIANNVIDATGAANDGITLHDGDGLGLDNRIVGNTIFGPRENCIDVLGQYRRTEIRNNDLSSSGEYTILVSHQRAPDGADGTRIIGNRLRNGAYAAINVKTTNAVVSDNIIQGYASQRGASALLVSGTASVTGNHFDAPPDNQRPVISIVQDPDRQLARIEFLENSVTNRSSQPMIFFRGGTIEEEEFVAASSFDRNIYQSSHVDRPAFAGMTFPLWQARQWGPQRRQMDAASTIGALSGY